MPVYRQPDHTWRVELPHRTENGETKWITERGFATKQDAFQWERDSKPKKSGSINMTLRDFAQSYFEDNAPYLQEKTLAAKKKLIDTKLLPYLGEVRLCDMTPMDVHEWQKEIEDQGDFKAARSQLYEILDHAVRFYGLARNPARLVRKMPSQKEGKRAAHAREECQRFAENVADERIAHCALEVLSWSGLKVEELLALTRGDVSLKKKIITIRRAFESIDGGDITAEPRPLKTMREVKIPGFLCDELEAYMETQGNLKRGDRLFPVSLPQNALAAI